VSTHVENPTVKIKMDGRNKQKEAEQRDCQRTLLPLPPSSRPQKVASSSICVKKEANNYLFWGNELEVSEQEGRGYHEEYVGAKRFDSLLLPIGAMHAALAYLCKQCNCGKKHVGNSMQTALSAWHIIRPSGWLHKNCRSERLDLT